MGPSGLPRPCLPPVACDFRTGGRSAGSSQHADMIIVTLCFYRIPPYPSVGRVCPRSLPTAPFHLAPRPLPCTRPAAYVSQPPPRGPSSTLVSVPPAPGPAPPHPGPSADALSECGMSDRVGLSLRGAGLCVARGGVFSVASASLAHHPGPSSLHSPSPFSEQHS